MLVLAHRGANRLAPENTLAAMTRAVELGADGVELDVHRTLDDELVVRHDADSPAGVLSELTRAEIRVALPDVPTLTEVLDVCAGRLVNVEVKDPTDQAVELLVAVLAARDGRDDVIVSSFHLPTVDRVRTLAPAVPTALLTFGVNPVEALVTAIAHGHAALHPDLWSLAGEIPTTVVDQAHEHGVRVNVWTVNDPADIRRLHAAGTDAVITDVPDLALAALAEFSDNP